MRVGIIGGGFGLRVQAPIIKSHPMMKIVAVSTMKRHQLPEESSSGDYSPNHYKNWTEMLDKEELNLLFVSSMPVYHYQMVKYALKKGINVVCEKPFTMHSKQSEELLQLSKKYNAKVLVDFEWRYLPIRQKVKEMINNNQVGRILHFEYHTKSPQYLHLKESKRGWMGERDKFGGMLGALGTHMIDCLRWLVDDEVENIHGLIHTHVPVGAGEKRDSDDAFFIHGLMKNKTSFSIQLLTGINHGFDSNIRIYGDLGTISLVNDKSLYFGRANENLEKIIVHRQETVPSHLSREASAYFPAFYPFLDKVYQYIENNKRDNDLPTVLDGHVNQIILDKILEFN
ncbi:Gfo/Idh/MocA family protein [Pseudogracilibacillus sp. SO30301A]|uniref:Gfo/Idh/MocA family protein n=1 Tax=Pseudogracilibacillus sp. SO30301A TaxID=3098291 RepID=UPI00300DD47F